MKQKHEDLAIYLKDHYAGGVAAIELLEHLADFHDEPDWKHFFQELLFEVKSDHDTLHRLIDLLGFEDSSIRNTGAWIAEKFSRVKIGFGSQSKDSLRDLETLETLFIGITGKRLLWRALAEMNGTTSFPITIDLADLERRASEQLEQVEARRLQIAARTFGPIALACERSS